MKWTWWVLSLVFLSFVIVQYNDPDPWSWMVVYTMVTANCVLAALGRQKLWFAGISLVILSIMIAFWLPGFVDWVSMGMPSLVESMKADKTYIEEGREFLGLVLAALVVVFTLFKKGRKASPSR